MGWCIERFADAGLTKLAAIHRGFAYNNTNTEIFTVAISY